MWLWILCFWFQSYIPSNLYSHLHCGQYLSLASYCSFFCATPAAFWATIVELRRYPSKPSFFCCFWLIYFGYPGNSNTRDAFFFCLRTVGTLVISAENWWNSLKVVFTDNPTQKLWFSLFWCILCMSSLIFPVQAKISTIQPKFLDYLSVSYHYKEIKISLVIYLI